MVRGALRNKENELEEKETERNQVREENQHLKESLNNARMVQQSLGK